MNLMRTVIFTQNLGTGQKSLMTLAVVVVLAGLQALITAALRRPISYTVSGRHAERVKFLTAQTIRLITLALMLAAVVLIWFGSFSGFATAAGLITAGLAVALQSLITSFAAYFIIMRGKVFTVGDRITIGGVRGDVVDLGFTQTTVMEMGEPLDARTGDPSVWITARQYTGRLVRITNDQIFKEPVYNYTREFPFIWEEIKIVMPFNVERAKIELILLDAAKKHVAEIAEQAAPGVERLRKHFFLPGEMALEPRVYFEIANDDLQITLRFLLADHGIRERKDAMTRDILDALDRDEIMLGSSNTFERSVT